MGLKRKAFPFFLGIIVIVIPMFVFVLKNAKQVEAGWSPTHSSYPQRKQLTVVNNSGDSLASTTTVAVSVDTKSLYDAGKLQSDCDDLRIVYQPNSTTFTELSRYVINSSSCATSTATKVNFPLQATLASSASSTDYYVYYGNPQATAPSNPDNAFDIGAKDALLVCPFDGSTTCAAGETPSTATGAIRYSGSKSAMSFDGANDYLQTSSNPLSGLSTFTVEWYMKSPYAPTSGARLIGVDYSSPYISYETNGKLQFNFTGCTLNSQSAVNTDSWVHVAFSFDGTNGRVFLNGSLTKTDPCSGSMASGGNFRVNDIGGNGYANLIMDEFRISDSARYTSNFSVPTAPFVRDANTKLLLHFDENGDDPRNTGKAIDDSGNGNHGTITGAKYVAGLVGVDASTSNTGYQSSGSYAGHGGVMLEEATTNKITNPSFEHSTYSTNYHQITASAQGYWRLGEASGERADSIGSNTLTDNNTVTQATGKIGNAGQFTAVNSEYLSIADNVALSTGDIDFTISAWVYADTLSGVPMIAAKGTAEGTNTQDEWALYYHVGLNRFRFFTANGTTFGVMSADSLGVASTGTWYFIVGWHDSIANTVNIQVNNGAVDSVSYTSGGQNGTESFRIGWDSLYQKWDGRIDEVGFWKRTLSASERTALYNAGTGIDPTNLTATENTTAPYYKFGSKSAKLVAGSNGASDYLIEINAGSTSTHALSAYVYNGTSGAVGGTVDATVAKLVYNGTAQTTTYTDMGGGWWRLTYSAAGINAAANYGVQVLSGKTVYVDGVQLEALAYATTYADGTLGTSYAWTGTANNSTSSRTVADLQYNTSSNVSVSAGSISVWVKFNYTNATRHPIIFWKNNPESFEYVELTYRPDGGTMQYYWGGTSNSTVFTPTLGRWYNFILTRSGATATLYINTVSSSGSANDISNLLSTFQIGGRSSGPFYGDTNISDLRIYDSALTSAEVTDLYYSGLVSHSQGIVVDRFSENKGQNPVATWHMDEGYGSTMYDSAVTDGVNNGTISGATWQSSDMCVSGKCLKFDGNDFVEIVDNASLDMGTGVHSISAWIRLNSYGSYRPVVAKRSGGTIDYNYHINDSLGDGKMASYNGTTSVGSSRTVSLNEWHYVSWVYDSGTVYFYLDGKANGSSSQTSGAANSANFYIGKDNGTTQYYFDGFIDEVKIYPYARSAAQVKVDYTGSSTSIAAPSEALSEGLVGYWKMDESSWTNNCSTASVLDSSGSGNNGTACPSSTGPTGGAAGKFGNAGSFDGSNDYVQVADNNILDVTQFTLSAWAKTSATNDYSMIIDKFDDNNNTGYNLGYNTSGGVRSDIGNGSYISGSSTTNVEDGNWHLITSTYDGNKIIIYVDGVAGSGQPTGTGYSVANTKAVDIGNDDCCGGRFVNGTIDDVRIYNRALSPKEVRDLYNFAPGPKVHLKMDEGSGASAQDSSGNSNTGTLNDGPTWNQGKFGKGIKLDGLNDDVSVGDFGY